MRSLHNHPTSADVYEGVRERHPNISRATVYRNLGVLAHRGEVLRVEVPNGADRYDFFNKPHYHASAACAAACATSICPTNTTSPPIYPMHTASPSSATRSSKAYAPLAGGQGRGLPRGGQKRPRLRASRPPPPAHGVEWTRGRPGRHGVERRTRTPPVVRDGHSREIARRGPAWLTLEIFDALAECVYVSDLDPRCCTSTDPRSAS
ncbi:MAG: transcriptional repressor [Gordonibacter pamelaeae]